MVNRLWRLSIRWAKFGAALVLVSVLFTALEASAWGYSVREVSVAGGNYTCALSPRGHHPTPPVAE